MNKLQANKRKQNIKGWLVVACGGIFYMYQYMVRVSPNIMNDELLINFAIDSTALGLILGAYNWSYSAMQIPLGITIDRFGPRFFLCIASIICALACFIFGNTTNPIIGGGARFLIGMGSACGLIGTIKLGIIWLEPKHIAKVTGLTILMGTVGASLGGAPLEMLLNKVGFQKTMEFMAIVGIFVSFLIFLFVSNKPEIDHHNEIVDIYENKSPLNNILLLVKNPQAWIFGLYGTLMYLPITVIGVVWGISFVNNVAQVSDVVAASVVSSMFLGCAIGSPCFAYFSDCIKNRRLPMFIGSIVTSLIWFIIFLFDLPLYVLYILFFIAGFVYTAKCLTFASICEAMPLHMSGVSIAFVNTFIMAAGIIFLPVVGALLDFDWNGEMHNNIPLYTADNYRFALIIIPILLAFSSVLVFFMKETHPDHKLPKEYGSIIDMDVI